MGAVSIDGFEIARKLRGDIAKRVRAHLTSHTGPAPCLAVILVGDDPASAAYVAAKGKALAECGMTSRDVRLPAAVSQAELLYRILMLNSDPAVQGILLQMPLPPHIDRRQVVASILPEKDVDGFHPLNLGKLLVQGEESDGFVPCTPRGVLHLLDSAGIQTSGAHAVILGRSNLVGKPLAVLLGSTSRNATVTVCHTRTRDLAAYTRSADILVAAAGVPGIITAEMVKPGAAVIDVGISRAADSAIPRGYRLAGDVDFPAVSRTAGWITPVPRGVGPMTIAMLLHNTLEAAIRASLRQC
ncbi:MAG: bifunctional 5,10-methylenetetrahydrofolate dehydrogenase/5,10-methenyltetrahydrofolate cyclohydrolase [Spirochaetaceae bacterium]|jgi:methylenetetrahydrofolate dehydrogenase (NADP+)/methenyltetrahydrofolate cyclohydrolase|nr:bifunctional 5,10-methylenetetrahydrofolate dehydrogenase/5,10-methenyltetrahydrofolate cyclohydrolase [Spirochaetaceae bacterium]